jgi:hypothetical protein
MIPILHIRGDGVSSIGSSIRTHHLRSRFARLFCLTGLLNSAIKTTLWLAGLQRACARPNSISNHKSAKRIYPGM